MPNIMIEIVSFFKAVDVCNFQFLQPCPYTQDQICLLQMLCNYVATFRSPKGFLCLSEGAP